MAAPSLIPCASLWSLVSHPSPGKEWSLERKLEKIAGAGFPAVTGSPALELTAKAREFGLRRLAAFIAPDLKELRRNLDLCSGESPERVNIQIGTPEQSLREAIKLIGQARTLAAERSLTISFETHRGTVLETPDKLQALATAYRKSYGDIFPVTWDYSHHAVVRQLPPDTWPEQLRGQQELVAASDWFHLRPHSAHHVQVPVIHGREESAETRAWIPLVREMMRLWMKSPKNRKRELFVTPELGPRGGYALAASPPVWPEVLALHGIICREWSRLSPGSTLA